MSVEGQSAHEEAWVQAIRRGDERAFEQVFHCYYRDLCVYASGYVKSFDTAREVVQDVFLKIWENRESWYVRVSIKAYLYRAVRNQSLNYVKSEKRRRNLETHLNGHGEEVRNDVEDALRLNDVTAAYRIALGRLPERRKMAFMLHREHGLNYAEIARVMDVSERTVEWHIAKALESLRVDLMDVASSR